MAPAATEKRKFTYEDYLKTPDDERFELMGGELLMTLSPVPRHQRISGKIEFELRKYVVEHDLGEVFDAPCDVHLDNENVVQPEILFISNDRLMSHLIYYRNTFLRDIHEFIIDLMKEEGN